MNARYLTCLPLGVDLCCLRLVIQATPLITLTAINKMSMDQTVGGSNDNERTMDPLLAGRNHAERVLVLLFL